jgi:hypothetical protein
MRRIMREPIFNLFLIKRTSKSIRIRGFYWIFEAFPVRFVFDGGIRLLILQVVFFGNVFSRDCRMICRFLFLDEFRILIRQPSLNLQSLGRRLGVSRRLI